MDGSGDLLKQIGVISWNTMQTVKSETVLLDGKQTQLVYRNEWSFTGYYVISAGAMVFSTDIQPSERPYSQFENARGHFSINPSPDVIPFVIHTHGFASGSSPADSAATRLGPNGTYIFTINPATGRTEILLPNQGGGYRGSTGQVFPPPHG